MKFLQVVTLALLLTTGGLAATIYVPDNYATIQAALDAAVTGDTIVVRPGAYFENIDFLGKNVVLRSEAGADYTTIEGRQAGSVVTFQSGEGPGAVLEGFNIANGSGTVDSHNRTRGGGIYCVNGSSPVIRNNVISANFADIGGGISIDESSLSIIDNVIKNNRADNPQNSMSGGGGGIHCRRSSALVQGNVIEGNITLGWSAFGGGFRGWYASATIIDNLFEDNRAYSGGALALDVDGAAGPSLVEGNRFFGNQADWAGAISSSFDTTVFSRNEIRANNAENGGGVAFYASKAALQSCMITANGSTEDGGAIICTESSPSIVNCTIVANQAGSRGGAIGCGYKTNPNVVNTILWANIAPIGPAIDLRGDPDTALTISYSAVQGGQAGINIEPGGTLYWKSGMIMDTPLFADLLRSDFHLTIKSPCRNRGDVASVPPDLFEDHEGDVRIHGGAPDIGADEFHPHLYFAGRPAPGTTVTIHVVGPPSTVVTLGLGSGERPSPLPTPYGDLFLEAPIMPFGLGTIPPKGVLSCMVTLPWAWLPGSEKPLQALIAVPGGPGTVLSNLMVVVIER